MIDPEKFKALYKSRGMTQREIAAAASVSLDTISSISTGRREAQGSVVRAVADAMGMTRQAFITAVSAGAAHRSNGGRIPIINKTTAGVVHDYQDVGHGEYSYAPVTVDYVNDPDAFAVELVGDSMSPEYCHGDLCVFGPNVEPRPGDACFIQLIGGGDEGNTFKLVYPLADGSFELRPINTRGFSSRDVPADQIARIVKLIFHGRKMI